jgi:hypothetical protein
MSNAMEPQFIAFKEISSYVKKLGVESGADTLIGSMATTKGIFVLLFSHRLNKEFSFIVPGTEIAPVMARISEIFTT